MADPASRTRSGPADTAPFTRRIEPAATKDALPTSPQVHAGVREIRDRVLALAPGARTQSPGADSTRSQGGLTALFAGPATNGKAIAAEVIAGQVGAALYRIDLSRVVSKYIGETEKNLARIFRAVEKGSVLFFDEAEALFGKRADVQDAHDRYANSEVSALLEKMKAFRGLAILAVDSASAHDPGLARRFDVSVDFPVHIP